MWRKLFLDLHRHRKFQLIITSGTLGCFIAALLFPHYNELIIVGGTVTNLIWIWE